MKCNIIIDPNCEEEITVRVREESSLTEEIQSLIANHSEELIGYGENTICKIVPTNVCCFLVESNHIIALVGNQRYRLRERLYTLEEKLGSGFVKINQSCLANIKKINRFETSFAGSLTVVFENGHRDYVSRRQLKFVKERIGF